LHSLTKTDKGLVNRIGYGAVPRLLCPWERHFTGFF